MYFSFKMSEEDCQRTGLTPPTSLLKKSEGPIRDQTSGQRGEKGDRDCASADGRCVSYLYFAKKNISSFNVTLTNGEQMWEQAISVKFCFRLNIIVLFSLPSSEVPI